MLLSVAQPDITSHPHQQNRLLCENSNQERHQYIAQMGKYQYHQHKAAQEWHDQQAATLCRVFWPAVMKPMPAKKTCNDMTDRQHSWISRLLFHTNLCRGSGLP